MTPLLFLAGLLVTQAPQAEAGAPLAVLAPLPPALPAPAGLRWMGAEKELDRLASEAERAADRGDPSALARLYRLENLSRLVDRPARIAAALEHVAGAAKADPLTRAHARFLLSEHRVAKGQLEEARKLRAELGLIDTALVLGPFDNSAGRGHAEAYPPENGLDVEAAVPGRDRSLSWRSSDGVFQNGRLELSSLVSPPTDATTYALVLVEADQKTRAALRTGSSDALKVFLDGRLILDRDHARSAELDQDATPIVLPAGKSLLLLKSSWSGGTGRVLVRLTQPDGAPLSGVRVSADRTAIAEISRLRRKPAPVAKHRVTEVTAGLDGLLAQAKGERRVELLALRSDLTAILGLFDHRKLPSPPIRDLDQAIRLAPDQPLLRFFYAFRVEHTDPSLAREQLEAALASDPGFSPAALQLARIAEQTGRRMEARALLEQAIEADPGLDGAHVALAAHRSQSPFERELALQTLEQLPEAERTARIWSAIARSRWELGDRPGAVTAAERALSLDFTSSRARSIVIDAAIDSGQIDRALAKVEEEIALRPHVASQRVRRARLLAAAGDRPAIDRALAALEQEARAFPDHSGIAALRAQLFLRAGDKAAALAELDRSLAINPQQRQVRRHRAALSGEHGELEDRFTADAASYLAKPPSERERAWGAAYLLERTAVRLYDDGNASRYVQTILRMSKAELRDLLRHEQVRYSPSREVVEILSAERLRPNGEVIKATRISDRGPGGKVQGMYLDQRWKNVEFDDLEAGDLIHLRYRIDSFGPNIFGGFFGDIAPVQGRLPIERLEYIALAPASRQLFPGTIRAAAPQITQEGGVQRVFWAFDAVEPVDLEPMAPPYPDFGKMVSVSTYQSWDQLARWYANLYRDQLELDESARQAGKRAVRGAKDEAEKIRRLHDYVVKSTRYVGIELGIHGWKPFKASEVHRRRYGDCKDKATLLAALLRDNGVDATIALVRTADRGGFPADHATMWAFNHAITYIPSADLYLDGTAEFAGSTELPWQDQGAFVLVVNPDGTSKLDTPPESAAAENLNQSSYQAELLPDGTLRLQGEERFFGARAANLRQEYEEPRTRVQLVERSISQVSPGAQVTGVEFSDLSDLDKPASYRYGAVLPRYAAADASRIILPLTLFPHQVASVYGALAERKLDLFLNYPWATRNVVKYQLPEGAKLEALPQGVTLDTPYVSLDQRVREVPGGFETDDTVTLKTRRIPAEAYPQFREALLAIDRALERKVVVHR